MNRISLGLLLFILLIASCEKVQEQNSIKLQSWKNRAIDFSPEDSFIQGQSYLSVYSQIYSFVQHKTHDLTVTVSMRNTSIRDSLYILNANYYSTTGELIRTYFEQTIFLKPLETVEIVIGEKDEEGGTGANFIFDWAIKNSSPEPLFESVMISTSGQQGLSFTSQGVRIK